MSERKCFRHTIFLKKCKHFNSSFVTLSLQTERAAKEELGNVLLVKFPILQRRAQHATP